MAFDGSLEKQRQKETKPFHFLGKSQKRKVFIELRLALGTSVHFVC